jgi:hypothetical protein
VVSVRPADLRIVEAGAQSRTGVLPATAVSVERGGATAVVHADVAVARVRVAIACAPDRALPAPGARVGLAFAPARASVAADPGAAPMRRGPDGPYLVDARRDAERP